MDAAGQNSHHNAGDHHPKPPQKKQRKNPSPEVSFQLALNSCSKTKDLFGAISLFESALAADNNNGRLSLSLHHINSLLYICSESLSASPSLKEQSLDFGFRVFDKMLDSKITPNESTITSVARLSAARGDGEYAFELARRLSEDYGIEPRLRTYDPALYWFCENSEADRAYEVEKHMESKGVILEEPEIAALLKVSAVSGKEKKVYEYLHKLRKSLRGVSGETAQVIENWFGGEIAEEVGTVEGGELFISELASNVVHRNGGGYYGKGWLGSGKWVVRRGKVGEVDGVCGSCGDRLACVDLSDMEREEFAGSIAKLAFDREVHANFREFQAWVEEHADYEAIVDGANIGLYQQNFADGGFNVAQLEAVVKELQERSKGKFPLVILHNKRLKGLMGSSSHKKLLEEWIHKGVMYGTPGGSNDDWYWLYAAVKLKCLLVTNDQMRDHIFELLGGNFFSKWKERHQVKYTFVKGFPVLQIPPPFSMVIQESERGSWHVPITDESCGDTEKTWLCIARSCISNGSEVLS
ncbi:hypothetical protein MLD38_008243 [Melastoma candidum]|uniref:Uncharacterized protein n=1 Tax=Melastoma candidum TaxID=119954 RepID=A0ACB9RTM5_9MYRT|nr:hypothetical protein MLD38_008243 [Melastoma candidum]